jgi:hypothetical protein
MESFQPRQRLHAENILKAFTAGIAETAETVTTCRYALLWADVQCGKTGTYHCLIKQMLEHTMVERVYILCGSNETRLRSQAFRDAETYNREYLRSGHLQIVFRQDFHKTHMDIHNALIVVDESHLDQSRDQQLAKFLDRHAGLSMAGSDAILDEHNAYIVSVDATPYSEIAALTHGKSNPKHVERFVPDAAYFGIAQYKQAGLIRPVFDFVAAPDALAAEMERHTHKYFLFRVNAGRDYDTKIEMLKALCEHAEYDVHRYDTECESVAITADEYDPTLHDACLEFAPPRNAVVLIKGRLRAGKVVPKEHVGFVWEDAATIKTDTLVQGLVGRMCGYAFGKQKPTLFVPAVALATSEDPTKDAAAAAAPVDELTRHILGPRLIPAAGTNLVRNPDADTAPAPLSSGKTLCPPFRLDPTLFASAEATVGAAALFAGGPVKDRMKTACLAALRANLDAMLEQHRGKLSEAQESEIRTGVASLTLQTVHLRHFFGAKHHAGAKHSYYKQLCTCYADHSIPTENIATHPFLTFCPVYKDYQEDGAVEGTVYVVIYTTAAGLPTAPSAAAESDAGAIPLENGKSIFSVGPLSETRDGERDDDETHDDRERDELHDGESHDDE